MFFDQSVPSKSESADSVWGTSEKPHLRHPHLAMTTALLIAASLAFTPGLQVTPGAARVSVPTVDSISRATPVRMAGWNDPWEDSLREKKDPAAKLRPGRGGAPLHTWLV